MESKYFFLKWKNKKKLVNKMWGENWRIWWLRGVLGNVYGRIFTLTLIPLGSPLSFQILWFLDPHYIFTSFFFSDNYISSNFLKFLTHIPIVILWFSNVPVCPLNIEKKLRATNAVHSGNCFHFLCQRKIQEHATRKVCQKGHFNKRSLWTMWG